MRDRTSTGVAPGQHSHNPFVPLWWLRSPHLQTLWAGVLRSVPRPDMTQERLELPDGDFVDLAWSHGPGTGLAILLHGLEGSLDSTYIRGMVHALLAHGWQSVVMHFRGCSATPNRLPRTYHSGDTQDLALVAARIRERFPEIPIAAIGFSLGGNVLLKWLGESGARACVDVAVAVSAPMELAVCAKRLEHGISRIYQRHLIDLLHAKIREKFSSGDAPIDVQALESWRTFRSFDDHVTAPLHGFAGVDDYYARASARQYLGSIGVPTLIIQARDDPFMSESVIPAPDELSAVTTLEVSEKGGHVAFIGGTLLPHYWLEDRIPRFLDDALR